MSLLDLAARFTTLKRAGRQFAGPCPLPGHAVDKTPSFFITLDDTRWFCWGCLQGGGYRALHAALLGEGLPGGDRPAGARPRPKKPCLELTPWGAFVPSAEAAVQALLASLPAAYDRTAEATAWARAGAEGQEKARRTRKGQAAGGGGLVGAEAGDGHAGAVAGAAYDDDAAGVLRLAGSEQAQGLFGESQEAGRGGANGQGLLHFDSPVYV